jgi:hypothetical protein
MLTLFSLYSMVDDPATDNLICWSKDGETFMVPNHVRFGDEVLPRFFKHNRFSSFVRQLNMYGFHKVPNLQQGALKSDVGQENELWEFKNDNFKRDRPELLLNMQRKKGVRTEEETVKGKGPEREKEGTAPLDDVTGALMRTKNDNEGILQLASVWSAIQSIQNAQQGINDNLRHLHSSNTELFREAAEQRARSQKQEETINKMLRFLAGVFGAQDIGGGKGATPGSSPAGGSTDGRRRRVVVRPSFHKNKSGRLMIEENNDQIEELEVPMDDEDEGIANIEELPAMSRSNSNSPKEGTTPRSRFSTTNSPSIGVQDLSNISSEITASSGEGKHNSQQAGSQITNALSNGDGNAWLASLFGQQQNQNQQTYPNQHSQSSNNTIDPSSNSDRHLSTGNNALKLDAQTLATLQNVLGNMSNNAPENQIARNYQNLQGSTQDAAMVQNALNSLLEGLKMGNGVASVAPDDQIRPVSDADINETHTADPSAAPSGSDAELDLLLKEFLESGASTGSHSTLTPTAMGEDQEGQTPDFAFSPNGNGLEHHDEEGDIAEERRSSAGTSIDAGSTTSTSRATSPPLTSRKRKPAAFENAFDSSGHTNTVKGIKNPKRANVS